MLRKLMKHELRSTSRIMLPLFAVVLVLSLCVSLMVRTGVMDNDPNPILGMFCMLITAAYGIGLAAMFIVVLVLMINRFRTNLLGDEGYVMFTLPVSTHQLIWSKILISCLWFVGTCIVVGLSAFIVAFDVGFIGDIKHAIILVWQQINTYYALNGTAIFFEALILFFISYAAGCLQFYSAMAVGYSFDRRKGLYSVLFFFGSQFVIQMLASLVMLNESFIDWINKLYMNTEMGMMASVHTFFGMTIIGTLIYCAIFYFITTYFLQKRLNIE